MENLQIGTAKKGCRIEDFNLYDPTLVYFTCQACDFNWTVPINEFYIKRPTQCPLCDEYWIYGSYIVHDMQMFENRKVPNLTERHIIVEVAPGENIDFGEQGLYQLKIYPLGYELSEIDNQTGSSGSSGVIDENDIQPEFIKIAYLVDPNNLENNSFFNNNILKVIIEDERSWKRAYLYNYRVINAIQDV